MQPKQKKATEIYKQSLCDKTGNQIKIIKFFKMKSFPNPTLRRCSVV